MATFGKSNNATLALWLGLAAIVILADQVTKTLIVGHFEYGDVRPVNGFFSLVRAHNKGAAFSMPFFANSKLAMEFSASSSQGDAA